MMFRVRLFFILFFFSLIISVSAQTPVPDLQTVTFSSPNVANMNKFGNIPIGLFTGTPNISVPIYTVKIGDISLPITLNYHASGIKVSEVASWAGLGWNLDYGGMITREVRGFEDENSSSGYLGLGRQAVQAITGGQYPFIQTSYLTAGNVPSGSLQNAENIANGSLDGQPDLFHFSCGGRSGNFFFNKDGNVIQVPQQNLIIQPSLSSYTTSSWTIMTPEGLSYTYGPLFEYVSSNPGVGTKTGWFLTEIQDQMGNQVLFKYKQYSSSTWNFGSESKSVLDSAAGGAIIPNPFDNIQNVFSITSSCVLDTIETKNEIVVFNSDNNRTDMTGENKLDSVCVFSNVTGQRIKKAVFYDSYFSGVYSTSYSSSFAALANANDTYYRLRLDSLTIDSVQKYKFAYNPSPLPERMSYDQDLWGYYNAAGNTTMIPYYLLWTSPSRAIYLQGGNRIPDSATASAATLTSITYPTGGYTSFYYEANTVYDQAYNGIPYLNPMLAKAVGNYSATATTQGITYSDVIDYTLGSSNLVFTFSGLSTTSSFTWSVALVDSATLGTQYTLLLSNGLSITPPPGAYKIRYTINGGTSPSYSYMVYCNWSQPQFSYAQQNDTTKVVREVGGIRIKEMDDFDPVGNVTNVKKFSYNIPGTSFSSGQVVNYPIHERILSYQAWEGVSTPDGSCIYDFLSPAYLLVLSSYSTVPISINSGDVIGYSWVTEQDGAGSEIHQTISNYTNVSSNPDYNLFSQFDIPVTPYSSVYFNRGLLLDQKEFTAVGGGFQKNREVSNVYSTINNLFDPIFSGRGIIAVPDPVIITDPANTCDVSAYVANTQSTSFTWRNYETISGYNFLSSSTEYDYNQQDTTKFVQKTTSYAFVTPTNYNPASDLLLPRNQTFVNSKGDTMFSNFTYDFDLSGVNTSSLAGQGINNLFGRSLYTMPVEITKYKKNGSSMQMLNSSYYTYNPSIPRVSGQYTIDNGFTTGSFSPISVVGQNLQTDPNYILAISKDAFDGFGNLLQEHKAFDYSHSYIWDYNATYPIAEVLNAGQSDIAYTSFEADGTGNWTIPDTIRNRSGGLSGSISYALSNGSINKSGLNTATNYVVSYWLLNGSGSVSVSGGTATSDASFNGWTYYEVPVSGATSVMVSGTGTIDELRLYPKGAQMSTYTYSPLIGVTAHCDPSGHLTFYTYDNLCRLHLIKDQYGNILKRYDYEYQVANQ